MQRLIRSRIATTIIVSVLFTIPLPPTSAYSEVGLPEGLYDPDPMVRLSAVQQVGGARNKAAALKLASMAKADAHANIRAAACTALAAIEASTQLGLLSTIAVEDPNAAVRAAATKAIRDLKGEPPKTSGPIFSPSTASETPTELTPDPHGSDYEKPTLNLEDPQPETRYLAVGFGCMGGYGIAALNFRGRIPTGVSGLPWIGLELGGGWTPPGGYQITAGPLNDIENENHKWKIISGAGAVLLYLHRKHYIPLRGGFDIGRGGYAMLGYGFEQLNAEGFFSWGVEVGVLYQPVIQDWIDHLVNCDENENLCVTEDIWPVIPFVRFSLHFYLL